MNNLPASYVTSGKQGFPKCFIPVTILFLFHHFKIESICYQVLFLMLLSQNELHWCIKSVARRGDDFWIDSKENINQTQKKLRC